MGRREFANRLEQAEANALVDFFQSATPDVAATLGLRVKQIGAATAIVASKLDFFYFNNVYCLGLAEPPTEEMVSKIVDLYKEAGVSGGLSLNTYAEPPELESWLEKHGFKPGGTMVQVYRERDAPPHIATDLRIEQIGTEYARPFAEIVCRVFHVSTENAAVFSWIGGLMGREGWRHYMAFSGEEPAATGSLFVKDGVGWLGFGATRREYRRRGAQGAIMSRRVQDALDLGCNLMITETDEDTPEKPNPSYHNMVRTGFKPAYTQAHYTYSGKRDQDV